MKHDSTKIYNPLYFLSSLGNGGLAVSFFMYLMFMVKHPSTPIPVFEDIYGILTGGDLLASVLTGTILLGILYFAFKHVELLIWNIGEYGRFKKTKDFPALKASNNEVTLMALPLTYAMTVNVAFILGALFVPGLWKYVEYLFPLSLVAFVVIGGYGILIFAEYFSRLIVNGDFDFINNNNLSQLLASFAFTMIGVGFASPGAMSHNLTVSVLGILGAVFFSTLSVMILFIKLVLGFKSMFRHGISKESSPSLWIVIPILTLLGITFVRVTSGIYHNILHAKPSPVFIFIVLAFFVSVQLIFGMIGYVIMKKKLYFRDYITGEHRHEGSFTLICPGVASFVLGMFFVHWGFVNTHIITLFSPVYFVMLLPLVLIQFKTIQVLFHISRKLVCKGEGCFSAG